jgi:hypothetical protein
MNIFTRIALAFFVVATVLISVAAVQAADVTVGPLSVGPDGTYADGVATQADGVATQADGVATQAYGVATQADGVAACQTGSTGWDHCEHIWQSGITTYCWLKSKKFWVRSSNDVSEKAMIACTASTSKLASASAYTKFCLFNVTSCASGYGDWSYMRLWEY